MPLTPKPGTTSMSCQDLTQNKVTQGARLSCYDDERNHQEEYHNANHHHDHRAEEA